MRTSSAVNRHLAVKLEEFRQARRIHGGLLKLCVAALGVKLARLPIPTRRLRLALFRTLFSKKYPPGLDEDEEPGPPVPLRLVIMRDTAEHPQVARRRAVSAELAGRRGIEVSELAAEGDRPLHRLASLVHLADYAAVYLGIATGVDPGPVAAIGDLKDRIA